MAEDTKIGIRVGAICNATETEVNMYGWGTYQGKEVPPKDSFGWPGELGRMGVSNPKIVLDNGKVIWGCECWWGGEERIKSEIIQNRTITEVDIDDHRREAAEKVAMQAKEDESESEAN